VTAIGLPVVPLGQNVTVKGEFRSGWSESAVPGVETEVAWTGERGVFSGVNVTIVGLPEPPFGARVTVTGEDPEPGPPELFGCSTQGVTVEAKVMVICEPNASVTVTVLEIVCKATDCVS